MRGMGFGMIEKIQYTINLINMKAIKDDERCFERAVFSDAHF